MLNSFCCCCCCCNLSYFKIVWFFYDLRWAACDNLMWLFPSWQYWKIYGKKNQISIHSICVNKLTLNLCIWFACVSAYVTETLNWSKSQNFHIISSGNDNFLRHRNFCTQINTFNWEWASKYERKREHKHWRT